MGKFLMESIVSVRKVIKYYNEQLFTNHLFRPKKLLKVKELSSTIK